MLTRNRMWRAPCEYLSHNPLQNNITLSGLYLEISEHAIVLLSQNNELYPHVYEKYCVVFNLHVVEAHRDSEDITQLPL